MTREQFVTAFLFAVFWLAAYIFCLSILNTPSPGGY